MSLSGNNAAPDAGDNAVMLFGVRLTPHAAPSSFRKSASMINLSHYDQPPQDSNADNANGYESDDVVHASATAKNPDRKRGVPWSEDEHRLFLVGLEKVGKGDWRGISRNFVKTRTPTQVASHAQKYFLRRTNHNRRRRRSSLFDITTDTFLSSSMEEEQLALSQETTTDLNRPPIPHNMSKNAGGFPMSTFPDKHGPAVENTLESFSNMSKMRRSAKVIRPTPMIPAPPSSKMADLNLNSKTPTEETSQLSLKLSTPSEDQSPTGSTTQFSSAFQALPGGDSMISVA
ncbi:Duplicated homeodomain-like superfamily protein [Euphorbia peplus]|nr:Duplicated homeodomain-like superfamily protein [Euphorbia peplus]